MSDSDAVPAADVRWHLFADAAVTDADAGYGAHAEAFAYNDMLPEPARRTRRAPRRIPFRVQSLTGGIPVPAKPHLVGSLNTRPDAARLDHPPRTTEGLHGRTDVCSPPPAAKGVYLNAVRAAEPRRVGTWVGSGFLKTSGCPRK